MTPDPSADVPVRPVGIVTDSNSQITDALRHRFAVEVVPMTVTIDGVEHHEGVDLDADGFYDHFADGRRPEVTTSQPSPGEFVEVYRRLADAGCEEIWSIHIAEAMSGTIGSARIAAADVDVPVHIIDTGSASFGVTTCVWAAAMAIGRGGDHGDVRRRVEHLVGRLGTAFMVGVPLLTERGGRAGAVDLDGEGIPILSMHGGELAVLERVTTVEDAIDVMSTYATSWVEREPNGVTVAIGIADAPSRELGARLEDALAHIPGVDDIVPYRVGPSVGAHTGPGTFGLFVFPTIR